MGVVIEVNTRTETCYVQQVVFTQQEEQKGGEKGVRRG